MDIAIGACLDSLNRKSRINYNFILSILLFSKLQPMINPLEPPIINPANLTNKDWETINRIEDLLWDLETLI